MRPADTSPAAWKVFLDLQSRMPPAEKLSRALEWSALVQSFEEAGLREKFQHADEREIFLRSARQRLGYDLFRKVHGDALPDDEPVV